MDISNNEQKKIVNQQIEQATQQQATDAADSLSITGSKQREVQCPFCAPHVKKKDVASSGRSIVIPFLNAIFPVFSKEKTIKPDPQKCICEGKQKLKDASDKSAKYEQVKQQAEANIQKSIDLEAKMGTGGNRTTVIEKSETLIVGLGFNKNSSFDSIPKAHYVPGSLNTKDPQNFGFPQGKAYTKTEGLPTSLGWPSAVGNYNITCANSYNLIAGAGGIKLDTKGPLTLNCGILNLTGPQVNLGSSSGPLTLEGDTVSIGGKTITLTPTDANVFVKGTVSATGNVVVGGQLHAETISFSKASCPAKDKRSTTNEGNPDVTITSPAVWGGAAVKAIQSALLDIQTYFQNIPVNPETAAISVLSPTQMSNLMNRFGTLIKLLIPLETMITGVAWLPSPVGPIPIPVQNFPHIHGIPSLQHDHGTRIPDIDCENYASPQALRTAVMNEALTSNAPARKKTSILDQIVNMAKAAAVAPKMLVEGTKKAASALQFNS